MLCLVVSAALVGACVEARPDLATPTTGPSPSAASALTLEVVPINSVGRTIGGQPVVFLVKVDGHGSSEAVDVTATAPGATVTIEPQPLPPGVVGEISVVPASVVAESDLEVRITARRGVIEKTETRTLAMVPGEDFLRAEATEHLDAFVAWLAIARPELGIDGSTTWEATPGSWVLVVNHYLFFSPDWEVDLEWHVMIAPHDWSRIHLRRRWTETTPSLAFEISSVAGRDEPHEISPADAVWR